MFYIQQTNDHDCGFTCLKILLANLNHDENYLFFDSPFEDNKNTSLLDLVNLANHYHLTLLASKVINKEDISSKDKVPFIAILDNKGKSHAVYVYHIGRKYVYYYDPSSGKKKLKKKDFNLLWSGECLRVEKFTKTKCGQKKINLLKEKERIFTLALSFASVVFVALGLYFINKDSYIYLPIIFFTLTIILEIIIKKYNVVLLSRMDKRMMNYYEKLKNDSYYLFYQTFEKYKKYVVINNISLFANAAAILLISFIMLLNDKINAVYIGLNIVLVIPYLFLYKPTLERNQNDIVDLEATLKKENDESNAFYLMKSIRKKSYLFADFYSGYKYLVIAIQFIVTFIMMLVLKIVSVQYVITYLFLNIYLYNNILEVLNDKDNENKENNLLNYLSTLIIKKK